MALASSNRAQPPPTGLCALVTGASVGIGKALALECARDGLDVILVSRSEQALEEVALVIRSMGRQAVSIAQDLAAIDGPRALYNSITSRGLTVDVLINNAGVGAAGLFWELSGTDQMRMLQVNVAALTELTRLFMPAMIAARRGYVLNVASTAAFQPGPLMAVYYATKAYVLSFSSALYNEARDYEVGVTALCPGPTASEFAHRAGLKESNLFKSRNVMSAEEVARIGYAGMKRRKPVVVTGRTNAAFAFLTRFAPRQLAATIARSMNG
jgi:short-subunit dehydrogenase